MAGSDLAIVPVVLAGGSGYRLWPLSRAEQPKQFAQLMGERTPFQEAVLRTSSSEQFVPPLIVAGEDHRFIIQDQLEALAAPSSMVILEPEGKNTAPAAALAAFFLVEQKQADALMLLMPSDHYIAHGEAFLRAAAIAVPAAVGGRIVTFGVAPDAPETGYGYIHCGMSLPGMRDCYHAERFIEKPDRETAEHYIAQGSYLWNSGIFLVSAKKYLESLKQFEPEVWEACRMAIAQRVGDGIFLRPDAAAFHRSPSISIDYAVMERAGDVALVPADMGWSDLGSWQALSKVIKGGTQGNQVSGDVLLEGVEDSYVRSDGKLVAVLGMKDVVVVAQGDAVLVGPKSRMQEVRKLTEKLASDKREEARTHLTQRRPWGQFHRIDKGANYQVKKLTLKPGGRISLQRHYHRAEHWIVVGGAALVTRGNEVFRLGINESTYIQPGMVHRLENREEEPLHLIEVQTGTYLGEDDIERLDDHYGRR